MQFGTSECLQHWARYTPTAPAIVSNGEEYSYSEVNSMVDSAAGFIRSQAPSANRIAVGCVGKKNAIISYLATLRLSKSAIVLHSGWAPQQLASSLAELAAGILIADTRFEPAQFAASACKTVAFENISLTEKFSVHNAEPAEADTEWGVLFSSGTTGASKGIARDHHSMVTEFLGWCLELGLRRRTSFYIGRPVFYTGGLVLACSVFTVGGVVIVDDYENSEDPREIWQCFTAACKQRQVEWAFFLPEQVREFIKHAKKGSFKCSRTILVMGSKITGEEKVATAKTLKCKVVESWGNTESLGTITEPEDLETRPASIGRPFLTDVLKVVREDGEDAAPMEVGRIVGNEDAGFSEYVGCPEKTDDAKVEGFIKSTDFGYQDESGYFYFQGREDQSVTVDGTLFFGSDIESRVRTIELVRNACALAAPQDSPTRFILILETEGGSEVPHEQITQCLQDLPPSLLLSIKITDQLPKLGSGKIDRQECCKIWAEHGE